MAISPRIVLVPKVPDPFFRRSAAFFCENSRQPTSTDEHYHIHSGEDLARSPQSSAGRVPKKWSATVSKHVEKQKPSARDRLGLGQDDNRADQNKLFIHRGRSGPDRADWKKNSPWWNRILTKYKLIIMCKKHERKIVWVKNTNYTVKRIVSFILY